MARKVGDLEKKETEKKEKGHQDFDIDALKASNAEAVNEDGLLLIAPTGYHFRKHKPLKKESFVSESIYLKHQAVLASQKAEFYVAKASELAGKAERLEKFGSEAARKAASKLAKAKSQMATLRQQLIDTGMSAEEIDALIENM